MGLCTDSSAKAVEFVSDPSYRRKVYRGDSTCFLAMDQKEVLIEVIYMFIRSGLC